MKVQIHCLICCLLVCFAAAQALAQEQASPALTMHVVQRGENLFRIALQYDLFADQVAQANGLQVSDSLQPGQRLLIPLGAAAATPTPMPIAIATAAATPTLTTVNPAQTSVAGGPHSFARDGAMPTAYLHTVAAGETLFVIGLQYNLTVDAIAKANDMDNPNLLRIGQQLTVPGIELPKLTSALPDAALAFTIDPLVFKEGQTSRIELWTRDAMTIAGTFLGQDLPVITREAGRRHNLLVGVPMFTPTAIYPLELTLMDAAGEAQRISARVQVISGGYFRQSLTINDSELLAREVETAEFARLAQIAAAFSPQRSWEASLRLPATDNMNAFFGTLRSYNGSPFDRYHSGVDFAGAVGTSVRAAAAGEVKMVERLQIRGNTVMIDHGWGIYSLYAHLNATHPQVGAQVQQGEVIGTIGSTGRSTGPHLHWEVWVNGVNVAPLQWVNEVFP
ncbi:MAG: LysM peptidoglycan-binding domain-containing M23 family metallopeptidase [Chloroflexi bacterium]|nr:LysM peptidoglycan-binding domain-containing M23 family metallopeptidase [Chloroflexota bacterium]